MSSIPTLPSNLNLIFNYKFVIKSRFRFNAISSQASFTSVYIHHDFRITQHKNAHKKNRGKVPLSTLSTSIRVLYMPPLCNSVMC